MKSALLLLACVACGGSSSVAPDASPTGDSAVDTAPGTCGARGDARGYTHRTLTVGGVSRTYLLYLPQSASPTDALPVVLVFHGYSMSGQEMADITQYDALAESEHIALAFPDGEGGAGSFDSPWNVKDAGQTVCGYGDDASATGDDFAFVDAIEADLAAAQCIDSAHVFATGFSMGGYFAEHLGCERSDIRAIAPHSGGTLASLDGCTTQHVPVILFHGAADSVIDDACDDPTQTPDAGFPAAATLWAAKNGCATTYTTVPTTGTGGAGQCYVYDGCPADGQVELCTFTGMDHCWAGGATQGANGNSCPTYASATTLAWQFYKQYAW
ncbi:MAG TPA: PHB depolymerase family esterase [Kofleriaceae bacterium]|jgi:poly(3-hydroxybutyrate) depolymerase